MSNLTLKMDGRSGCLIEILQYKDKPVIRKYSNSIDYNKRLLKQVSKQSNFFYDFRIDHFKTPVIFDYYEGNNENFSWFEMEFIHAEKYSDYLERTSIKQLNHLIDTLFDYFNTMMQKAVTGNPDENIFLNKIKELRSKTTDPNKFDTVFLSGLYQYLETNIPTGKIPLSTCHGDFTLSNMLFTDSHIYLIDFLDSFIESPIIDIVKLRQDTHFKWSLMIDNNIEKYREYKLIQILDFIDLKLEEYCNTNPMINNWYTYLQLFNLLRILPYVHNEKEISFVQNSLKKIFITA
jgi:thiamine kinase-like enzyme